MSSVELYKSFASQMSDYIARHNSNYSLIESTLNDLLDSMTGQSVTSMAVPSGLQQIFDRRGLIGAGSYDFSASGGNITVQAGAYYNSGSFYAKSTTTSLSMTGLGSGTYYLNLDSAGNPKVSSSPDTTTSRQFSWNGASISAKALYAGVSILFDGDDYHDCLDSTARGKSFTSVAARLEEIETLLARDIQAPAAADAIAIDWSRGGTARVTLDRATTAFRFSGAFDGQRIVLELTQDATGGRGINFGSEVQAGTDLTFPVPLSSDPNKTDYLGFIYDQTSGKYRYVSLSRGY
jgi:hypothetical protein